MGVHNVVLELLQIPYHKVLPSLPQDTVCRLEFCEFSGRLIDKRLLDKLDIHHIKAIRIMPQKFKPMKSS